MLEIISCQHRSQQRDAYVHYVRVRTSTNETTYLVHKTVVMSRTKLSDRVPHMQQQFTRCKSAST